MTRKKKLPPGVADFTAYRDARIAEDVRFAPKQSRGLNEEQKARLGRLLAEEHAKEALENIAFDEYQHKQRARAQARKQQYIEQERGAAFNHQIFTTFMDGYGRRLEAHWAEREGREVSP